MSTSIIDFKVIGDERGSLIALENNHNIPFDVKRVYYIYGTKTDVRRGYHAHINLRQVAICVHGSCKFLLDDGSEKKHVQLDSADKGLLIEGLVWREMYDFSQDCVLIVLADEYYAEDDYIRNYNDFTKEVENAKN